MTFDFQQKSSATKLKAVLIRTWGKKKKKEKKEEKKENNSLSLRWFLS